MSKALYCGSFDPITLGHMDIIKRAASIFGYVEVAVGNNTSKKYMFTFKERLAMVRDAMNLLPTNNVSVSSSPLHTLTIDHARTYGFDAIIKGVRTNQDFDYEKLIHEVSATQQQGVETVVLFSAANMGHVSSSAVKELAKYQGLIHKYVPLHVKAAIEAKMDQYIIGVTGTIGSGKSTLCRSMYKNGVHHVNMDELSHELFISNLPIAKDVQTKILNEFGTGDRKELGELVFGDEVQLKKLNAILKEPMLTLLRAKLATLTGVILLEGALLAEADWLFLCNNRVILVKTPSEKEHNIRLKGRGYTDEQLARRIASQYDYDGKLFTISQQLNKDQFGKCLIFDSENPDLNDATANIWEFIKELTFH